YPVRFRGRHVPAKGLPSKFAESRNESRFAWTVFPSRPLGGQAESQDRSFVRFRWPFEMAPFSSCCISRRDRTAAFTCCLAPAPAGRCFYQVRRPRSRPLLGVNPS